MSNAPVYYALAQARFNPVAAMSKYVDQIQDRLRREGYPLFESQQVTPDGHPKLPHLWPVKLLQAGQVGL